MLGLNMVHVHLVLNHVPTVGTALALAVLAIATLRHSLDQQRLGLEMLVVIALATLPVYVTGVASQAALAEAGGTSSAAVLAHQNAAFLSFFVLQATGLCAWLSLWRWRRLGLLPTRALLLVSSLGVVALLLMAEAANRGGSISHEGVGWTAPAASPVFDAIDASRLGLYTIEHLWVWPTLEILHVVGMAVSFGVLLVIALHAVGASRVSLPYRSVHKLLPWGMAAVAVNITTGMLFVNGVGPQYTENPAFFVKVALLALAGLAYLYLTVADGAWSSAGEPRSLPLMVVVALTVLLWVGVMYLGRMLPYLRQALAQTT